MLVSHEHGAAGEGGVVWEGADLDQSRRTLQKRERDMSAVLTDYPAVRAPEAARYGIAVASATAPPRATAAPSSSRVSRCAK